MSLATKQKKKSSNVSTSMNFDQDDNKNGEDGLQINDLKLIIAARDQEIDQLKQII